MAEAQIALGRRDLDRGEIADGEPLADVGAPSVPGVTGITPQVEASDDELAAEESAPDEEEAYAASTPRLPERRGHAGQRAVNFVQGSWRELQRVQWPDRRQVMQATGVVIGFVIVAGLYLALADTVASRLMNFILK